MLRYISVERKSSFFVCNNWFKILSTYGKLFENIIVLELSIMEAFFLRISVVIKAKIEGPCDDGKCGDEKGNHEPFSQMFN